MSSISNSDIDLICMSIDALMEFSDFSSLSAEDEAKIILSAQSAKSKLQSHETMFKGSELSIMLDALLMARSFANKQRATARKGTAAFKRNMRTLSDLNRLISILRSFSPVVSA